MLKKIGLPVIALLGMLAMAPHQANAAERFRVRENRRADVYRVNPAYPVYPVYPVAPAPVFVDRDRGWHDMRWDRRHDFRRR